MDPIKEALTFDDVTLAPNYSEILPSEVKTEVKLSKHLNISIPLLTSAMDTVTESNMAISIGKKCEDEWCKVKTKKIKGWIKVGNVWGLIN